MSEKENTENVKKNIPVYIKYKRKEEKGTADGRYSRAVFISHLVYKSGNMSVISLECAVLL